MIASADLIYPAGHPKGQLRTEWFPDENLAGMLDGVGGWIALGYQQADAAGVVDASARDGIAEAWAYWKGYSAKSGSKAEELGSVGLGGEISTSTPAASLKFFEERAAFWLRQFTEALASAVVLAVEGTGVPHGSFTQGMYVVWS